MKMSFVSNSRTIQRMTIDSLRLACNPVQQNPRKQVEKAKKFLAAFDQIPLIYADPDGEILAGEEILLALRELGAAEVDVVVIQGQSPAGLMAIRLALHRMPADARWNEDRVRIALEELEADGIDLDLTGFDPPEIDSFLN